MYIPISFDQKTDEYSYFQDSMSVISDALIDVTAKESSVYTKYQFERLGFFSVDPDTTKDKVGRVMLRKYLIIIMLARSGISSHKGVDTPSMSFIRDIDKAPVCLLVFREFPLDNSP